MGSLDDGRRDQTRRDDPDKPFDMASLPTGEVQDVRRYYEKYKTFLENATRFLLPLLPNDACRRGVLKSNTPISLEEFAETILAKPSSDPVHAELVGMLDRGFRADYSETEHAECRERLEPILRKPRQ